MCYTIVTEGKENPKNQKGYSMKKDYITIEYISRNAWDNLCSKVSEEYSDDDLKRCYDIHVPVCVRWNNRNVYASVIVVDDRWYSACNFYRISRDGSIIRLLLKP